MDYTSPLRSKLKIDILSRLQEKECNLSELTSYVKARNTTILHVLKEFINLRLVAKTSLGYKLTSLGTMEAQISKEFLADIEVIHKFSDFWLNHDLSGIPTNSLLDIGALKEATLIKTEAIRLKTVHNLFLEIAQKSKELKGISPIFHPDFVGLFARLLEHGSKIELIVSDIVLKKILEQSDSDAIKKFAAQDSLRLFLGEDLKIALLLTEEILSLGLFKQSGEYDDNSDLFANNREAVRWGQRLFEEQLKKSTRISLTK